MLIEGVVLMNVLALALNLSGGQAQETKRVADEPSAETATVAFTMEEISGLRPVVGVRLNGHPFRMMVHSNASFFAQFGHKTAALVKVREMKRFGEYGIVATGRLSKLGRDEAVIDLLEVGAHADRNAPVSIFETPASDTIGMLGLKWITANRAIIDFPDKRLTLKPAPDAAAKMKSRLRESGFIDLPMQIDPSRGDFQVSVTLGKATRKMTVSTVAGISIDTAFARDAGVALGEEAGTFGGPTGSQGTRYRTRDPITIKIGNWTSQPSDKATVLDEYVYSSRPRPTDSTQAIGGALGADFLIAHDAVVDFGNKLLFVKKPLPPK
jgi:hypothetical protein